MRHVGSWQPLQCSLGKSPGYQGPGLRVGPSTMWQRPPLGPLLPQAPGKRTPHPTSLHSTSPCPLRITHQSSGAASSHQSSSPLRVTHQSSGAVSSHQSITRQSSRAASAHQSSLVTQSCPSSCDPVDYRTLGFPVHHQLPELAQTLVH